MTIISIIEDNATLRESWKDFLNQQEEIEEVFGFESVRQAIHSTHLKESEILLLDIQLPGINGIDGIPLILKENPEIKILMVSVLDDEEHIFKALKAGAVGYMDKNVRPDDLLQSIQDILEGGSPISPLIAGKIVDFFKDQNKEDDIHLNKREKKILSLMIDGKTFAEIGKIIYLSVDGVRYHVRNIYYKLQVNNKAAAISIAIKRQLL
ncbi:response regulator transcription factor [Rhodohalobacter sp. 8-1]|uniref:response regulator transcription factor n=1 Tax=Rhodohalobacter sp. 8-1 TaxID=3131972 RepID=UPI0030EDFD06